MPTTISPTSNDVEALSRLIFHEAGSIANIYFDIFDGLGFSSPDATQIARTLAMAQ
jgi:hypothetical protein